MGMTISKLPHRMEPFGAVGWTVREFTNAKEAAAWFAAHQDAAMPCWRRMAVVGDELRLVS